MLHACMKSMQKNRKKMCCRHFHDQQIMVSNVDFHAEIIIYYRQHTQMHKEKKCLGTKQLPKLGDA